MTDKTVQLQPWSENPEKHFGGYSDKGPVRSGNEDTFWIPEELTPVHLGELFIVADGVGGQRHGRAAADRAALTIHNVFYRLRQAQDSIHDAIQEAILQANTAVIEESQQLGDGKMGSTIVTGIIDQDVLTVAHVGDARAYLLRQGQLRQLTRDDSWVQRQVDAGLLTPEEAANHELRNVVTQVLGNKTDITVHLSDPIPLQAGDLVMLCSDGLYDVLSDHQMSSIMINNSPQTAAEELVQMAATSGATDNITAVVTRYGPADAVAPIAATATATDMTIQDASPAVTPTASPATKPTNKSKSPPWLPLLIAGLLIIVVLIILGIWIWNSSGLSSSSDDTAPIATLPVEPTAVPAETQQPLATATNSALQPVPTNTLMPTATIEQPATIPPATTNITIGQTVTVANTGGVGVSIRSTPEIGNNLIIIEPEGTQFLVTDGPEFGSERQWWQVQLDNGAEGWAAAEFLEPVSPQ